MPNPGLPVLNYLYQRDTALTQQQKVNVYAQVQEESISHCPYKFNVLAQTTGSPPPPS